MALRLLLFAGARVCARAAAAKPLFGVRVELGKNSNRAEKTKNLPGQQTGETGPVERASKTHDGANMEFAPRRAGQTENGWLKEQPVETWL